MSGQAQGWVHRHGPRDRAMRAVLLVIADAANADGTHAHPGLTNLIEFSLYGRSTVLGTIRRLVEDGWVIVTQEARRRVATEFSVLMDMEPAEHLARVAKSDPARRRSVQNLDPMGGPESGMGSKMGSNPPGVGVQSTGISPLTATSTSTDSNVVVTSSRPDRPATPVDTTKAAMVMSPVETVFDSWLTSTAKTSRTVLDANRRRAIERALKDYPLEDIIDAVRGWRNSPWNRGENPDGKVYNDLTYLLRDAGKIERFRDLERNPTSLPARNGSGNGRAPTVVERSMANIERVMGSAVES